MISARKLIDSPWLKAAISGAIGTISLGLLVLTLPRVVFDYVLLPLFKDTYILPEWRYRIFDLVLIAWCADGLIAAVLFFRHTEKQGLKRWASRTMLIYLLGFLVLAGGVVLGIWLRRHGM